jgi:hypothetical protein
MPADIRFPAGREYVPEREAVKFPVIVNSRETQCILSEEALKKGTLAESGRTALELFDKHIDEIHSVARQKIAADPDATEYVLAMSDFRK